LPTAPQPWSLKLFAALSLSFFC